MLRLELKVPPDVLALVVAAAMWLVATLVPAAHVAVTLLVPVGVVLLAAAYESYRANVRRWI